jgi:GntR family transcriptional regulator, transcriptional repressor for pyruvate dehydrogenase complex
MEKWFSSWNCLDSYFQIWCLTITSNLYEWYSMNSSTSIPALSDSTGSLVSQTMRVVNEHIRNTGLKLGNPIPSESAFAKQLGVSRAVVREAFRSLAAVGVIELGNGRRARVGGIDETVLPIILNHAVLTDQVSILQIYDVRRTIEMRTVALAAMRRSTAEAAEISGLAASMDQDFAIADTVMEHDIAFHLAIARASKSRIIHGILAGQAAAQTRTDVVQLRVTSALPKQSHGKMQKMRRIAWQSISTIPSKRCWRRGLLNFQTF